MQLTGSVHSSSPKRLIFLIITILRVETQLTEAFSYPVFLYSRENSRNIELSKNVGWKSENNQLISFFVGWEKEKFIVEKYFQSGKNLKIKNFYCRLATMPDTAFVPSFCGPGFAPSREGWSAPSCSRPRSTSSSKRIPTSSSDSSQSSPEQDSFTPAFVW